jgi:hypothetical protein
MAVVCPRCSNLFDPVTDCPRCGATPPDEPREAAAPPGHGPRWQQTALGRILIGLILSQGLFYGLRHLLTGVLLAYSGRTAQDVWEDVEHLILWQAIQAFGVIAGGILAGGGQRQGLFLGAVVGAWNGAVAVLLRQSPHHDVTMVAVYGQPLIHAALGALGGWVGSVIWQPIPAAAVPVALAPPPKAVKRPREPLLAGKVHWVRVLAGSAFVVVGTLSATMIFQKVMDVSGNRLGTSHAMMDRLITWEIKALAVLVGGALAGATTTNGVKQGLFVGVASSLALIGWQSPSPEVWFQAAGLILVSTLCLTMVGGWFGGQLFPPVFKGKRRRDLGLPSW